MSQNLINKYFFVLFSIIPVSIIVGPSVSLANILIIVFSFLIYIFYINEWSWLKDKKIQLLFALYIYLIFNSFIALDFSNSFYRNFGFIRFIILFAAFNYFFLKFENFNKILIVWSVILTLVVLDMYYESINGKNILGFGEGDRIFSFFKEDPKVGGYISSLYLLSIGFLFEFFDDKKKITKYIILLISIFFLTSIVLTGERSNTIKAILSFIIFYSFIDNFSFKEKFISSTLITLILFIIFINSEFLKMRYIGQLLNKIKSNDINGSSNFYDNNYINLYRSGIEVFKKYPYFGTGNKNYGLETCYGQKNKKIICNSHPHQIYFEFLAEHGIVGSIIILFIFFKIFFDLLRKICINRNKIQFASFLYILVVFLPMLPSGSFFSDYLLTLFFINFSLLFCVNKYSNLFYKNN
jgi:O-antigen ligase